MADVKIDEVQARAWVEQVERKLVDVRETLKEVSNVYTETVGSDDTVFQIIEKTSKLMQDTWENTCNAFRTGWEKLEEGIGVFAKAGKKIEDAFEGLKREIQ